MQIKKTFRRRILFPLSRLLLGGMSPVKLAIALAAGFTIGCMPVIGPSAFVCLFAGWAFKLNIPAIQLGNYISTPLQIMLLLPAYEYGGRLFGTSGAVPDFGKIFSVVVDTPVQGLLQVLNSVWQAMTLWAICAPFLFLVVYFLIRLLLIRWQPNRAEAKLVTVPDTSQ